MDKVLLSGNEAVARGAWEAGVALGVGYPGTPSTEVLQNLAKYEHVRAEWAPNEKVALEVAIGVSLGGGRALVTMKHVGLNVATDPLFTLAYTGVNGGVVVFVADDPGMHSSQNEQDSRNYAAFARVPLLEPSDSQEALDFVKEAFRLSEEYDVPVLVRSTTRVSHSKGLVTPGQRDVPEMAGYESQAAKYVMLPGNAKGRRVDLDARWERLRERGRHAKENREVTRGTELGIITSGAAYQYVREALPEASVLKIGLTNPLPDEHIREFAAKYPRVAVVEELDPYLRDRVRLLGVELEEHDVPAMGELSPAKVARAFGGQEVETREPFGDLPARPPMMCPGCPHRGTFRVLKKMKAAVMGDIGCYTLGALPPLASMDTCVCMGASIGMAHGMEVSGGAGGRPVVAVIGDSTFMHSGLTGLMNTVYNLGTSTTVILDNRITAMTGHQDNPGSGQTLMRQPAPELDLVAVCKAIGAEVSAVSSQDMDAIERAISAAVSRETPSVVVVQGPCALRVKERGTPYAVDEELCRACGACVQLGCPAISKLKSGKAEIDTSMCVACGLCLQTCRYDAIVPVGPACDLPEGS